jgi:6-phosphogluconate dehydrogenase (decarboxylating)
MKQKPAMQLGMIGLGRMGANMVRRLIKDGHRCVVFDQLPKAVKDLAKAKGGRGFFARRFGQETRQAARDLADGACGGGG